MLISQDIVIFKKIDQYYFLTDASQVPGELTADQTGPQYQEIVKFPQIFILLYLLL